MEFDPTTLVATPKNWLETRPHYEGAARAEFTNPPGAIEGPATVCVNSAGRCRVRIKIEKIDAPDEKNFVLARVARRWERISSTACPTRADR